MADPTISAAGVGKRFLLHHKRATSLKERLLLHRQSSSEGFWALQDVNLEIGAGQTVGLIGPNGSGKSTLLKVLSGILAPTTGTVEVRGRIASLLELGAGFNGELTGRENVYLNAAILGLSRRETQRYFDDIVAFAELEPFIDNQVKHYSSGQYVRLGFAVAVHVSPDILLIDEVLAVGDESFQRKCLDKIAEFQQRGCTILFVTHALDLIPRICSRGVVLDHGRVLHDGDPVEAAERLRSLLGTGADQSGRGALRADRPRLAARRLFDPATGLHKGHFRGGEAMAIDVDLTGPAGASAAVRVAVTGPADVPLWLMDSDPATLGPDGTATVRFGVKELPQIKGIYALALALRDPATGVTYDARRIGEAFLAVGDTASGILEVAWSADQIDTPGEEERERAAGDRGRSQL